MIEKRITPECNLLEPRDIPSDWNCEKIGLHFELKSGSTPSRTNSQFFKGNIPWTTSTDLNRGIILDTLEKISKNAVKKNTLVIFPKGTLVIALYGLEAKGTRGNCGILNLNSTINQACMAFKENGNIELEYLFYFYLFYGNKIALKFAQGTKQQNLYKETLENIYIHYPKKIEQKKIILVLTNIINLIKKLDDLLTKKKNIRQGTIQNILTGKKRLEGFDKEWKIDFLEDIGGITGAGVDKKINSLETSVRLVNFLDVYNKDFIYSADLNHKVTASTLQISRCAVKKGDIFFTPSSEVRDDIGVSAVSMEDIPDAVYSYHVVRLRLFQNLDVKFWNYIFKTKYFLDQCEIVCEGSGTRYVITLKKFKKLKVNYPKDVKEQQTISKLLYDIDLEIKELEKKKEKYNMIKNTMMQKLLTGEIRLP